LVAKRRVASVHIPRQSGVFSPVTNTPAVQRTLDLQRTVGNRAVAAFLVGAQPKLIVGAANDPYEREADAVAEQVMANIRSGTHPDQPKVGEEHPECGVASGLQRRPVLSVDAPEIGLSGGELDVRSEAQIGALRVSGSPLSARLRRPMEGAFGTDFGGIRLHRGSTSEAICRKMGAQAFTVSNDIFFGAGTPSLEHATGQRLLAHELSHTIQQGAARSIVQSAVRRKVDAGGLVQRIQSGHNPKSLISPTSNDLLYGINIPRGQTKGNLNKFQKLKLRTIDDYNRAIGINRAMMAQTSAMGLYDVRVELASIKPWGLPRDPNFQYDAVNDEAIERWIEYLRLYKNKVGLVDLGQKASGWFTTSNIDKKGRFKKNRKESQANAAKADRLTSKETRQFLGCANKAAAQALYDAMSDTKKQALNEWIYRAFFRRTSKLGQDFTVKVQGAKVHFNTVSDPNYNALLGPNWQATGLKTQSDTGKNDKNRAITVSEYRHMQKLKKDHPNQFNEYAEI
jgi:hypothetical protein